MKNAFLVLFSLAVIGYSGYFIYQNSLAPCERVLEYSVGQFDTQFGLKQEDFKKYITDAEAVWEKEVGRELFKYKMGAKFKVNLIYDNRQVLTEAKRKEEFGLTKSEDVLEEWDNKLYSLLSHSSKTSSLLVSPNSSFLFASVSTCLLSYMRLTLNLAPILYLNNSLPTSFSQTASASVIYFLKSSCFKPNCVSNCPTEYSKTLSQGAREF